MNTNFKISGIHHITAIASATTENLVFYEKVLGLRLVKKTVNFDDPYTYHLYYGDLQGSPGTLLTFFLWKNSPRGKTGAEMVNSIAFSIPTGAIGYWQKRFNRYGIEAKESQRFGDRVIQFQDPHGLPLELITTAVAHSNSISKDSPIPTDHCIIGLHSATALLNSLESTQFLLMDLMEMMSRDQEGNRYRFTMKMTMLSGIFLMWLSTLELKTGGRVVVRFITLPFEHRQTMNSKTGEDCWFIVGFP